MIFTTRNPRDAERFVNNLPFTEEEKNTIKSFFTTTEAFMVEMKRSKTFNSKGGERWFGMRLQNKAMEFVNNVHRTPEMDEMEHSKLQFIAAQMGCSQATMDIAKECECSDELSSQLQKYVDFINHLYVKYTEEDTCPSCGSTNIANEGPEEEYTCHDCSHQWSE
jgi:hypothetical protein